MRERGAAKRSRRLLLFFALPLDILPMGSINRIFPVGTIRFTVQRSPAILYWRARGTIEYTEGGMFWTFIMTGAIGYFHTRSRS